MLITSLKVFCDLIETQSFSKTAALNAVTQSAISQQLKSIEKRQSKQLIEREKRRLTLTAEGEVFYRYAREIVKRYEEMEHRIQAMDGIVSGTVRLASIYSVGMLELAPFLKNYLKAFPRVNFRLQYDQVQKIYEDVGNGGVDLGIVPYPRTQRKVDVLPFTQDEMVTVMHPDHKLAGRDTLSPKELNKYPLVLFTSETPTRRAIDLFFKKHRVRPNIVMELDHIATIKHAVEVDIGISILPLNAVEQEVNRKTLACLHFVNRDFDRPLGILFRKGRSLSIATERLLDILLNGVQKPHL